MGGSFFQTHGLLLEFAQVLSFSLQEANWISYTGSYLQELHFEISTKVLWDIKWKPQSMQWQVFYLSPSIFKSDLLTLTTSASQNP